MGSHALTAEQICFAETFGYLALPGLLRGSIAAIEAAFEEVLAQNGGADYAGEHRLTVSPGINRSEVLCRELLDAAPLDGALTSLLGPDYQYWSSELSYCAGDTAWHSDSAWPEDRRTPRWYAALVYLDPLTADTGALRVIPGSHRVGDEFAQQVHRGIIDSTESVPARPADTWGVVGRDLPAVCVPSSPGDVILLNYMTAHASFGGRARRRLSSVTFFPRLTDAELDQLRSVNRARRYTHGTLFGDRATILRDASPSRMRHLEQILAHTPADGPSLRGLFL